MAQRWESINSIWNEKFKIQQAQFLDNKKNQHIIELLNLSEIWINSAYQKYNSLLETIKNNAENALAACQTIEILITEAQVIKIYFYLK